MTSQLDSLRDYVANRPAALLPERPEGVLLVGSGKGGVGTSTITALIAVMAAADGQNVLVVDGDASHGSLPLLFGVEAEVETVQVGARPSDLLIQLGHGLALLPIGGSDGAAGPGTAERRALIRRASEIFADYDLVVIDAGSRIEQVMMFASVTGTRLLAVTMAERIAAAATYALAKAVDTTFGNVEIDLVLSRCPLPAATEAYREIDGASRHFLRRSLGFAGAVPNDERLDAALQAGMPIQMAAAMGSPATTACHGLAVELSPMLTGSTVSGAAGHKPDHPRQIRRTSSVGG